MFGLAGSEGFDGDGDLEGCSLRAMSGLSGESRCELQPSPAPAGSEMPRAGVETRAGDATTRAGDATTRAGEAPLAGDERRDEEAGEMPMRPGEMMRAGDAEMVARVMRRSATRVPQLEARESAAESAAAPDTRRACVGVEEGGAATMLEMEYVFFMCTSSEST